MPTFVDVHLDALPHRVRSATHLIVGYSEHHPGIKDVQAMRSFMCRCLLKAAIAAALINSRLEVD